MSRKPFTLLITGFGSFPGAPFNPSARLVGRLMRTRRVALEGVRKIGHVFATTYEAVDRDLPALLAREKPDAILMFGVATRAKRIRVETQARNRRLVLFPDAGGFRPERATIAPGAASTLPISIRAIGLVAAARTAGARVSLSRNAGAYLCNYALWRGLEAQASKRGPAQVVFVHVPPSVTKARPVGPKTKRMTFDAMARTAESMMLAFVAQSRTCARMPPG